MYENTLTKKDSTQFRPQNETSNNEIYQEVFEDLHRKGGAKSKYEVSRNAPGSFRVSACETGRGGGRGGNGGEGTLLRT